MSGSACLDRMSIQGVRSFDEQPTEIIEFFQPLTLIVGQNGSGKTTIIECLKYACCGLLPPNSKNGAFIHDPQLVMNKEVKAQVKLRVKRSNNSELVITRTMSLTMTKTARKFKTLEGHLQAKQNGERTSISSTVAELDTLVPVQIGASRAILDNVIFCHQEESLWPMSEPSVLKKRFDEIFEAEKYTQAIDNIKVMRKKHNDQLAQFKIHEQHAKEDKERGKKQQDRMTSLDKECDGLRVQAKDIEKHMVEARKKSQAAFDKASEFVSKVEELRSKRATISSKEDIVNDLKSSMHAMEDSTEGLERMSEQYEERVQQYQTELESTTQHWHKLAAQIKKSQGEEGQMLSEHGRLQGEKSAFDAQVTDREKLVKESARHHNVRGYDHDLDHEQILEFMERIAKMAKDQNMALDRARKESRDSIHDVQSKLDGLRDQRTALSQQRENAKQQISANDKKVAEHRRRVEKVDVDEGRRAAVQAKLEDIDSKLEEAKSAQKTAKWHTQIADLESQATAMEHKTQALQKEMVVAAEQAGGAAELNRLKKVVKDCRLRLNANKDAQRQRISALLGSEWTEQNIESLFDSAKSSKARAVRDAESQRDGISREIESLGVKIKSIKDNLKSFTKEHEQAKKAICNTLDVEDPAQYPEEMQGMESVRDELVVTAGNVGEMVKFWKQIQATLKEKNMCWTCRRSFKPEENVSKFEQRVAKNIADAQQDVIAKELESANTDVANAKALAGTYERWARLHKTDIPAAKGELEKLEPKHQELVEAIERKDRLVSETQSANEDAESMSKAIRSIAQDAALARHTQDEIEDLIKKQATDEAGRSPDEINDEIQSVAERSRSVRSNLAKVQADRDRADDEITRLEFAARDAKAEMQTVNGQLKEKSSINAQIAELAAANEEYRTTLRNHDADIEKVKPQIQQVEAELDHVRQRRETKEKELRDEVASFTSTRDRLESANREIDRYLSKNGPRQLAQNEEAIKDVRHELRQHEEQQTALTRNLNKLKEQQNNHEETKRRIVENLRYRKNLHDLESLRQDIDNMESENAEADRQYWEEEGQVWGQKRNQLATNQAAIVGELKSKDLEIERLYKDWEVDGQNAPQKYKEANVRVEATKAVVEDLGRYGGALDKAVMRYHSLKMDQINRVIDELWRRTYQGTDVDTVLIRSENEGAAKGNKSHNYRVVMIKQDAEMDMRGRCSAGQKVLACIIIRLALAECFGSNCGMIALDEPTTNLDVHNIKALAESLHAIIQQRKAQSNFQLIVITHDEEFLRNMHALDHADDYFRIKRNINQKSVIRKERIQDLYQQ